MDDNISSGNSNLTSIVLIYVSTFAVGSLIIVCLTIYCCCQFRLRQKLREMRKLRKKRKPRSSAEFDILPRLVTDEEASVGGAGEKKAPASAKSKKTEFSDTGGKSKASLASAASTISRAAVKTSFRNKKVAFEKLKKKSRSMKSKSTKISSEASVHANLDGRQSPPANVAINESSSKSPITSGTISKNTQD